MKTNKIILSLVLLSLVALPVTSLAFSIPSQPSTGSTNVGTLVSKVVDTIWMVFAGIAVILFVWAGVLFLTAQGNPEKIAQARQAALWGVVGVVVMILAFSIFNIAASFI